MECGGFCEYSASFPVMCYLIDFTDEARTVHIFIRKTKLVSSFFKEDIEYFLGIEQSKISYFQALSTLK